MLTHRTIHLVRLNEAEWKRHIGKIYIVTPDDKLFESVHSESSNEFLKSVSIYPYEDLQVKSLSDFNAPELAAAVEENGATLVSAVLDCEQGGALFLMEHAEGDILIDEAVLFRIKVDKTNHDATIALIEKYLLAAPLDECAAWINSAELTPGEVTRGRFSQERQEEILKHKEQFIPNLEIIRNANSSEKERSDAEASIKAVCSSLSRATLSKFMIDVLTSNELPNNEKITSLLFLDDAAKRSDIKIFLKECEKKSKKSSNYQLTFKKGENAEVDFHIQGRPAKAIYITLLLDRCAEHQTESIYLGEIEKKFIGVYRSLYGESYKKAKDEYLKLFVVYRDVYNIEKKIKEKVQEQGLAHTYLNNITKAINELFANIDNPDIYHFKQGSRLHVDKDHINIPKKFIEDVEKLQSTDK